MWILRSGISETRTGNSLRVYPQWARALFKYLIVQSFWGWEWNKFEQVRFQLFCDPYSVYFRQKKSQAQFMVETLFLPWLLRGTFFWWIYTWNWSWQTWNRTCSNLFQAGLLKLLVLLDYDSILSIYMSNLSESFGVEKILTGAFFWGGEVVWNFKGLRNNVDEAEEFQPKIHAFSRKCQKNSFFTYFLSWLPSICKNRHTVFAKVVDNDPSNLYMNFQPNLATRSRENLQKKA